MSPLQGVLRSVVGAEKASALLGDLAEEAARMRAGRLWMAAHIAAYIAAAAWLVSSQTIAGGVRGMKHDIVFAFRLFRRRPGLFGLTIAGLAVAIGISTAVYSIVKAVAFANYGVSAPESVFRVALAEGPFTPLTGSSPYQGNWAFSDYAGLKDAASSLAVVASVNGPAEFRIDLDHGEPLIVNLTAVSDNYFHVLGLRTVLGRALMASDDAPGVAHAVVSEGFWKNRLGADPAIVGRTISLGDRVFTIVGVADRTHGSPRYTPQPPTFWTTLTTHKEMWSGNVRTQLEATRAKLQAAAGRLTLDEIERKRLQAIEADLSAPSRPWNPAVDVFGRLNPGVNRAQAETEVRAIASALAGRHAGGAPARRPPVELESLDKHQRGLMVLALTVAGIVGLVVFLACANVTNVLLASAAGRRREMGTRLAIGASRQRIVRQLLTESVMLSSIAGALGFALAVAILPAFAAMVQIPPAFDVSPDLSAYAFVCLTTIVAGLTAGLAPARYGRRGDLVSALKTDQMSAPLPLPRARLRSLLIGTQAAVSVVLLVITALLIRAVVQSSTLDVGYDPSRLVTIRAGGSTNGRIWSTARRDAYWAAAFRNLRGIPGVESISVAGVAPFSGMSARLPNGRRIDRNETSPEYFATLGLRLIRGRIYTPDEVRNGARVAVISARLAREYWGDADPLGGSLEHVWGSEDPDDSRYRGLLRKPKNTRVIGVVSDGVTALSYQDASAIYLPLSGSTVPIVVVRTRQDPHASVRAIRDAIETPDPSVRAAIMFPLDGMKRELEGPRTLALLAVIVGATALGLAVIGLFGVTAFIVEQRAHEVSVRRAMGATGTQIMALLFRDSLKPVAIGLACGLLISLLGGRVMQTALYGVSGRDPIAVTAAVGVLLLAATSAVLVPARRAVRVSPAHLLKQG